MKSRRGITLVELLVAATLFLLIGSLALNFFISLTRSSLRGLAKGAAEQQAVIIFQNLLRDMQSTSSNAVTWDPSLAPSNWRVLAIQPIEDVSNQGSLVFNVQKLILYTWDPVTKKLVRKEWLTGVPGLTLFANDPQRLTTGQLNALVSQAAPSEKRYEYVTQFDLGNTVASPNLSSPLNPKLVVVLPPGQSNFQERYQLSRTLVLRSQPE